MTLHTFSSKKLEAHLLIWNVILFQRNDSIGYDSVVIENKKLIIFLCLEKKYLILIFFANANWKGLNYPTMTKCGYLLAKYFKTNSKEISIISESNYFAETKWSVTYKNSLCIFVNKIKINALRKSLFIA